MRAAPGLICPVHPDVIGWCNKCDYARHPERERERSARYQKLHPEKVRERVRRFYLRHPERARALFFLAWDKKRQEQHLEKVRAARRIQHARYKKRYPEKVKADKRARRALHAGAPTALTANQWMAITARYAERCYWCRERRPLTQDHLVPLSRGGTHDAFNVVPACRSCNSSKGARRPVVTFAFGQPPTLKFASRR
jgi:5-methylcytosine-specific restriction endonuclease McrA